MYGKHGVILEKGIILILTVCPIGVLSREKYAELESWEGRVVRGGRFAPVGSSSWVLLGPTLSGPLLASPP